LEGLSGGPRRVILKRVKDSVSGAQEMAEMEHLLNVHASSTCKRSVAPFLGYLEVDEPRGRLTRGLWLMWEFEGDRTLAYYLRRRDCISALASDLDVSEDAVVPTVMQQIFQCLIDLHSIGLVHRDVKPANIVFCEAERRFKLIDLGAAADLRTGTNYKPAETILDPAYCPPEEYILPTDSPNLRKQSAPLALAISPLLWSQHRPDCFDTYSAGIILLQLGLPFLRNTQSLKNWKVAFSRYGYDLEEWRIRSSLSAKQTALLDVDDGCGWDLAAGLLRPREVETDSKGIVRFVNTGTAPRLTPSAAVRHPYLKKAAGKKRAGSTRGLSLGSLFSSTDEGDKTREAGEEQPAETTGRSSSRSSAREGRSGSSSSSSRSSQGLLGGRRKEMASSSKGEGILDDSSGRLASSWTWMKNKLFDLEARIMQQASDTQTQTGVVSKLRDDVKSGRASATDLEREESILRNMQASLQKSIKELNGAYSSAKGFLASVMNKGGSRGQRATAEAQILEGEARLQKEGEAHAVSAVEEKSAEVGRNVTEAATSAIYSGLKFTGMALNAMADFAAAAERGMSKAQEEAAARRAATAAYIDALQRLNPPLTSKSTWSEDMSSISNEAYEILTEPQKQQAFNAYVNALRRAERPTKTETKASVIERAAETAPSPAASTSSASSGAGTGADDKSFPMERLQELEVLRAEQSRLKDEYQRMEEKLRTMEQQLKVQNLVGALIDDASGPIVESEPDGSVIFKFAAMPPGMNTASPTTKSTAAHSTSEHSFGKSEQDSEDATTPRAG